MNFVRTSTSTPSTRRKNPLFTQVRSECDADQEAKIDELWKIIKMMYGGASRKEAIVARRKLPVPDTAVADAYSLCLRLCGNQPVRRVPTIFTKSFLGDDAAVLARSSGEEPASPRHRAGVASMAWRTMRRFSTKAP